MTNRKLRRSNRRMDTVKCECDAEILLLPDVKTIGNAIEVHVAQHIQKLKTPASAAAAEAESLRDALIAQVFSKLSTLENDGTDEEGRLKAETQRIEGWDIPGVVSNKNRLTDIIFKKGYFQLGKGEVQGLPSTQVIMAALNEEEGIGPTLLELNKTLINPRILVVDGRSTDRTVEIAKYMGADVVFQDGSGKGNALAKAIKCSDLNVDYVVITDADYTYPAEYVPEMIQILEKNSDVGMVCGNRFSGYLDLKGLNGFFYLGNRLIGFAQNFLNGVWLTDPLTGLRVVRAEILRHWNVKSKGFDVEVELNHHVKLEGFGIVEIPIRYRERLGEKKLGARHGAEIFKRIILETTY